MGKGAKRKRSHREHSNKDQDSTKATSRASWPESKPAEYLEEPRSLEDLWKAAFPVGTEWESMDSLYQFKWDFRNLEQAFEDGGRLHGIGNTNKVYLFGGTDPLHVPFNGELKVRLIPYVVAIVSPLPPSDKLGITSIQRGEEIVPMKQMKMDWIPYVPVDKRNSLVIEHSLKSPQIFVLGCTQRRAALRNMKIDGVMKFNYCLPYLMPIPGEEREDEQTVIPILFPREGKEPAMCNFDVENETLDELVEQVTDDEELSAEEKDALKEFVEVTVRQHKRAQREERQARIQAWERMSPEKKAARENLKLYKFYPLPTPDTPDISAARALKINRYYNDAPELL